MVSKKNLRDHVSHFYKSRTLSDHKAQRLVGLAQQPKLEEGPRMYSSIKAWRPTTVVGLTAAVAILLLAVIVYLRPGAPVPASDSAGALTPNLVAVVIQADWCARTPDVAPIFENMTAEYGNQPILFVTLDITDETGRQQARYMAANLGISSVYDDPFESGMVKLIDRQDGRVLAVLTGEEHRPRMEGALAQALPH